jgi:hypothetical protein
MDLRMLGVNDLTRRNIYPTSAGPTLGARSTSLTPYDLSESGTGSESAAITGGGVVTGDTGDVAAGNGGGGFIGQPLSWWFVLVALLVGTMFAAKKLGAGEEFRNVKMSVYNVVVISLASIIGIGFFKVAFNKFKVPGLTTFINAV